LFVANGADNLTAGNSDSVLYGSGGNDTLTGGNGNDNLFGQSGNDILNGGSGNDNLAGGSGNDIINGGSGNDTIVVDIDDDPNENDVISGGADIDTLSIIDTGAGGETLTVAYNGTRITQIEGSGSIAADVEAVNADLGAGADTLSYAGSTASVTVNLGTGQASGFGSISSIENVTGGSGADNLTGDAIGNSLNGGAGNDTVNGGDGVDTLNGGSGNDTVNGGDGNDFIDQVSNEGRDFIDGGVGADTYRLSGVGGPEVFRIYTRAAAVTAGLTGLGETTEIVVTRNTNGPGGAVTNANIIAELDNIEEISVNFLNTTANNSNNPNQPDGGSSNGDTIQVIGNFNGTSLNFSTITVDGHAGDDTVDITSLQSAHRIVFKSNGGNDTIVGTLRDQDVIELAPGLDVDDYAKIVNANGTVTWKSATHSVTYASNGNPILKKHEKDDDGDDETADNQDPVVTGEHFTIKKGEALTLTVAQLLANDVDPDGGTLSLVDIDEDEHGKAVLNPDGTITFKPKAGFTGEASFSYTVADGQGGATEGTVTIMVEKPAPVSLTGGRGHDRLYGDDANDRLKGRDGHDRLDGGDGADKMWGGRGNDTYIVDDRGDRVYEGRSHGIDTVKASVSYSLSGTHVEKLVLTGSEDLNGTGNRLDNTLTGNAGENVLKGKSGDDVLKGKGGDDRLYGGSGEDKLHGGSGDDRLDGGSGNDTLYGNSGQDVFVFGKGSGWDTVADFRSGQDKVDVSNLSGVKSTSDLNMSQVGEDAVILHGSDILVLKGVQASDLDGNDFIF
jgi:Ca2+-binding RTX toxin-like protein